MIRLIKDFLWFCVSHSSTMACCLIIDLAQYLSNNDLDETADYLKALYDVRRGE